MVDRRLGRGLDFFLSRGGSSTEKASVPSDELVMLEVSQLRPNPRQPRQEMDKGELDHLARSIQASGILQPILARKHEEGGFEIVAGERRWRAARRAGLEQVPVLVRDLSDDQAAVFALVENVQRSDLDAIEKARAFRSLQESLECSQEEVARRVGLDRSTVANLVRLLELPEAVQVHVSRGTLTMGHARALLGLRKDEIESVAERVLRDRLSVRQVEDLVKQVNETTSRKKAGRGGGTGKSGSRPAWLDEIEETLQTALNTRVSVQYGRKRSRIVIECSGREEFERVYELLQRLGE